jgi:nucleoside-diphosphate-sugar epimerase
MSSRITFITGATGFIGSHVVKNALAAGTRVRLSVRKEEQVQPLKQLFSAEPNQLEFVVIPDISDPKAFEGKLNDVEHILHLASPMPGKGEDFKSDYLKPAVEGTVSILKAAKASGNVKRVVVTSSVLAVIPLGQMNATDLRIKGELGCHVSITQFGFLADYEIRPTEDQDQDLKVDPDMNWPEGFAGHGAKYQASKILAHQATIAWMKENKPDFSLVTIHPTFVLGRSLIQKSAADVGGINGLFWSTLQADKPQFPPMVVDVRDVADAHLKAATVATKDQTTEFLLSGDKTSWDQVVSFIKSEFPEVKLGWTPPFAEASEVDTSRAENILGIKWRSTEEIFRSTISQQLAFLKQ